MTERCGDCGQEVGPGPLWGARHRKTGECRRRQGRIARWLEQPPRTREEALLKIRIHSRAMGVPLDNLSDQEIEEMIRSMAAAAAEAGMTAQEAGEAMFGVVVAAGTDPEA